MRFLFITSAALLLTPLAAAQFAVHARDASPDSSDISKRETQGLNERDAHPDAQVLSRSPVYTPQQIQVGQDYIKAQTMTYNEEHNHLNNLHAVGASNAELAAQHYHLQGLAQESVTSETCISVM